MKDFSVVKCVTNKDKTLILLAEESAGVDKVKPIESNGQLYRITDLSLGTIERWTKI